MTSVPASGFATPIVRPHVLEPALLASYMEAVSEVITSGNYRDRYGWSKQVERLTSAYLDLPEHWATFPMRSGTDALTACLLLAGVRPGDVVAAPDLAYHAVGSAILYVGAEPAWLDVDSEDWNLSPSELERFLAGNRAAAVVAVDNYGTPCAWPQLSVVCKRFGVPLVLDSCESLGARHAFGPSSAFVDFVALSYSFTKPIHSAGMGGAICAPAQVLDGAQASPRLMLHQRRLPELNAAYLALTWPQLDVVIDHLRAIYARYQDGLAELGLTGQPEAGRSARSHAPFLLPLDLAGKGRVELLLALRDQGIEARTYFPLQSHVFKLGQAAATAGAVADRVLCLPTGAGMALESVDAVIGLVARHLREPDR